jgi:hypothetical protein
MKRTGFWRWILNFGRIIMHNAAGTELFDFKYLKNPLKNYNMINHVHYKAMHNADYIKKTKNEANNLKNNLKQKKSKKRPKPQ